jgi:hypothetical protein
MDRVPTLTTGNVIPIGLPANGQEICAISPYSGEQID